ncbi:MAG: cytochrome c family protein [Mesorhizobium sp.]|uniref:c-type cytochrome n=1 Tax=Mesorhizobium sp. TaxID=1871066 RepID=UPI00121058D1|nr:cytochrome c family protein [Mesorhizobium sp.]TIR25913.1 MAG: cytochrome c family protein [Mesorhizobium sp.]
MRIIALFIVLSATTILATPSQAQDAAAGEKVFTKCKVCHVADQDQNRIGPSLNGVIGRVAGTHPNFTYSAAMIAAGKSGVKWDEPTLATYLHAPQAMVKGTKMTFAGLKDDKDIANVIAYLKQFSK